MADIQFINPTGGHSRGVPCQYCIRRKEVWLNGEGESYMR
jgi:hypothetical protein